MNRLKVVLVGAGLRGEIYTNAMLELSDKFQIVAVAEPLDSRRNSIKEKHSIPDEYCFSDWRELLQLPQIADVAIISTQDELHYEPAIEFIKKKYNLLLEKPISPSMEECIDILKCSQENGVKVVVCHVLRYTPLFSKAKELITGDVIGDIVSVNHEECVGNVHQSHSYVRGNWGNEEKSSFMLLAKSCHDIDIIQWLVDKKCLSVQSFGGLKYFVKKNAPENAPEYCIEGCPNAKKCPYDAVKLYLEDEGNSWFRDACTNAVAPTNEMVEEAIKTTQYGKCVFKCDNNVVDHQTVNMLFEDDVTVTFTMCAFNKGGRKMHLMGTKGEMTLHLDENSSIDVYDFLTKETTTLSFEGKDGLDNGHGGGDYGIVSSLYDYIIGKKDKENISEIGISCYNHILTFAAEEARKKKQIIDIDSLYGDVQF